MKTLDSMLDALVARAGSERKAAKSIGVSQQSMNRWRTRQSRPDDENCRRIALALELEPAYVLATIHGERARTKESRALWQLIAQQFGKAAMLALAATGAFTVGAPDARAMSHNQNSGAAGIHIVPRLRHRGRRGARVLPAARLSTIAPQHRPR